MKNKYLLSINDLSVFLGEKNILNNLNLNIMPGEVHIIMGPNGVGKSTLARILAGDKDKYSLLSGSVFFDGDDLISLSPTDISLKGLFLSFQNPIEIPGVTNFHFFKSFINCKRKSLKLPPIENDVFLKDLKKYSSLLGIKDDLLNRSVNTDFSGGEKKKNEILQMLLLNPKLSILDEIDSGLDIDSLRSVFDAIKNFKNKESSLLIITHYSRIINYIDIDYVHIMYNGSIIKTGNKDLVNKIDETGYLNYI